MIAPAAWRPRKLPAVQDQMVVVGAASLSPPLAEWVAQALAQVWEPRFPPLEVEAALWARRAVAVPPSLAASRCRQCSEFVTPSRQPRVRVQPLRWDLFDAEQVHFPPPPLRPRLDLWQPANCYPHATHSAERIGSNDQPEWC